VELTDGNVADVKRNLEMIDDALNFCQVYFEKQSEAMAAQHASTKVMYAPVCSLIEQGRIKIRSMQRLIEDD